MARYWLLPPQFPAPPFEILFTSRLRISFEVGRRVNYPLNISGVGHPKRKQETVVASNVVYINPAASANGSGSMASPLNTWSQVSFQPGTTYLQMAGTMAQTNLVIGNSATGSAPVQIGSYGTGAAPVIVGSVVFDGASNVSLTGFGITGGQAAGVILQNGSNNIQILSNTISNSAIGVWMGNGAGGGNTISGNSIINNTFFGIGVSGVVNPAGEATVMSQNMIALNGAHGIELEGSNFAVQNNTIVENGQTMAGSSGIHVYASAAGSGFGIGNVITGNIVAGTDLVGGDDGNGVELDQWTSGNTVSSNTIAGNDGSGIALYDTSGNTVSGNMVFANDAGPILPNTAHGEIALASSLGLTSDNTISGNTFLGIASDAPVVLVDTESYGLGNQFSGNAFEDFGAASMYNLANVTGGDATYWRDMTGGTDWFAGTVPADSGSIIAGSDYTFDADYTDSPLGVDFRFPWQTGPAYGSV